jgi:hypothetical protein
VLGLFRSTVRAPRLKGTAQREVSTGEAAAEPSRWR